MPFRPFGKKALLCGPYAAVLAVGFTGLVLLLPTIVLYFGANNPQSWNNNFLNVERINCACNQSSTEPFPFCSFPTASAFKCIPDPALKGHNCLHGEPKAMHARPARVAFLSHQVVGEESTKVLRMLRHADVDVIIHAGTLRSPTHPNSARNWLKQVNRYISSKTYYLPVLGAEDWKEVSGWSHKETIGTIHERASELYTCLGRTGVEYVCTFHGITMLFLSSSLITRGSNKDLSYTKPINGSFQSHPSLIEETFRRYPSPWRICVWQSLDVDVNEDWLDECRKQGALIITGEFSYGRSNAISTAISSSVPQSSVRLNAPDQAVVLKRQNTSQSGTTMVLTSGLCHCNASTASTSTPRCISHSPLLIQYPIYPWAFTFTNQSDPPVEPGALICQFTTPFDKSLSSCEYKQWNQVVRDVFFARQAVADDFQHVRSFIRLQQNQGNHTIVCNPKSGSPSPVSLLTFNNIVLPAKAQILSTKVELFLQDADVAPTQASMRARIFSSPVEQLECPAEIDISDINGTVHWKTFPLPVQKHGKIQSPDISDLLSPLPRTHTDSEFTLVVELHGTEFNGLHTFLSNPCLAPRLLIEIAHPEQKIPRFIRWSILLLGVIGATLLILSGIAGTQIYWEKKRNGVRDGYEAVGFSSADVEVDLENE